MDAKEILGKVKQLFADLTAAPAPTPAPTPAPLADAPKEYEIAGGGMCMIDKLDVGGIVMIDGAPALPGDLELADGTKLTVGDNGVISSVTPGAAAPPASQAPTSGEDMGAKFTALEASTNEKFMAYEAKFSAYEQRFAAYEEKLSKQNEMIEKLLAFGQLIVDKPQAPADPGVRKPQNNLFKNEELQHDPALFS